mgnify:CR=1 FL=1
MTSQIPHIIVVDDHKDIREPLAKYLEKHGYRVSLASDGASFRKLLKATAADLIVLDVMMPGEDGLSLCRFVRESLDIPVVLLTAMAEETDRIIGLELGADDYVVKPFNPRELLARIKAVIRRTRSLPPGRSAPAAGTVSFDGWRLDIGRRELQAVDGVGRARGDSEVITLSTAEFDLLSAFLDHPGRVLSREQLLDLARGRAAEVFDRSIDNLVSRLRRKIEPDAKQPALIKTVWGGGYMFTAVVEKA